ncbi:MAG TPA: dihydrodipicolinate synthase family protein [Micromonosporaceae bacterium]|nr:dihydrodipicolinate synthase family protein [Micromonosporaceae bacterium]
MAVSSRPSPGSVHAGAAVTGPLWQGVAVALVTFFDAEGGVDHAATAEHAVRLVGTGVRAVLVAGSTGEADALTDTERVALVAAVRHAVPAGVPVLAGASAAWTGQAVARVADAVGAGADAVLVAPPGRCREVAGFYRQVVAAADGRPVLAYHFPGVAGGPVPVEALGELGELPVAGVKDSSGDAERLLRELAAWNGWTYVGSSALVGFAGLVGAAGAVLAVANAYPQECLAAFGGDGAAQRRLLAAHLAARADFPHGLKAMVAQRFGTPVRARLG